MSRQVQQLHPFLLIFPLACMLVALLLCVELVVGVVRRQQHGLLGMMRLLLVLISYLSSVAMLILASTL